MKTELYNPSPLEVAFANALVSLKDQIETRMEGLKINEIRANNKKDNPTVYIDTRDADNDKHEFVINIIQRPDEEILT